MKSLRLLDLAEQVLNGEVSLGPRGPRVAAVMTRSAFEDWVQWMCASWMGQGRWPTMRSRLIVLRTLHDPSIGADAERLWHGLSRACHVHAYELQPSATEVVALHKATRTLLGQSIARATAVSAPLPAAAFIRHDNAS